jgi:hypothetical protein
MPHHSAAGDVVQIVNPLGIGTCRTHGLWRLWMINRSQEDRDVDEKSDACQGRNDCSSL